MTAQFPDHNRALVFETLEPRQLFAAPYLGTFRGIATYPVDGVTQHVKETITISPVTTTSAIPPNPKTNEAGIIFARAFGPITLAGLSFHAVFDPSTDDAPLPTSHTTDALPLGGTAYIGRFPSNVGLGIMQVFNNELTVEGTITTGIFAPASFNFDGTRVAAAAPAAAPPPATDTESLFKTLSLNQTLSLNPVLGTFAGHLTRASDKAVFKISAVVAKNKKGHAAITMQLIDPGVGVITIQSVIHPTHTGVFTLQLGAGPGDGILTGHVTHTDRLVLHLIVTGVSNLVGTQVRHH